MKINLLCAIDDKKVRFYLVAVGKDGPRCLKKEDETEYLQVNTHTHLKFIFSSEYTQTIILF